MIITIGCEKGGVGKSALAQTLAVYLVEKNKDVLLVDADPQRTSADWVSERSEDLKKIFCTEQTGNILNTLQDFDQRYQYVVVDCGGADSKALRSSLAVSNRALIPFRPKRRDLKQAPNMAELIQTILTHNPNLIARSILTQCPTLPSQMKRVINAKNLLRELDLNPLEHITCNRNIWDDCDEQGSSVLEMQHEDPKAASEALAVIEEFLNG